MKIEGLSPKNKGKSGRIINISNGWFGPTPFKFKFKEMFYAFCSTFIEISSTMPLTFSL